MSGWIEQQKIQSSNIGAGDGFGTSVSIYEDTAAVGAPYYENTSVSGVGAVNIFTISGTTWSEQQELQASDLQLDDNFGSSISLHNETIIVGAPAEDTGGTEAGSAYIFTVSGTTWTEQQKIQASDIGAGDEFGYSVALIDDTAIVGAPYEDTGGDDAGAVYVFTLSGTWSQQQKLVSDDIQVGDQFGSSVAAHGDTVVVGAPYESDGGTDAGAAYIFTRSGTTWTQQQKIVSDDLEAGNLFGNSVSIYYNTVVVGAKGNSASGSNSGAIYVFTRAGSTWTQQQKIQSDDIQAGDSFGCSVSVHINTLLVSAVYEGTDPAEAGAVYAFSRDGTTWTQQQKSTASDAEVDDQFGISVALYDERAIIGAHLEDTGGTDAGAAYILNKQPWGKEVKIVSTDLQAGDSFGHSVDISGDTAIVGAYYEDTGGLSAGAAYVFIKNGDTWAQQAKLQPDDIETGDRFGHAVATDNDVVIVGSPYEDTGGSNTGSAYIFTVSGTTWTQHQKLQASDKSDNNYFGISVDISGDRIIIGSSGDDDIANDAGSAYMFTLSGTTWVEQQKITASDAELSDYFGQFVAIHDDTAIVGAYLEDTGGSMAGSAYIFTVSGTTWTEQQKIQASDKEADDYFGRSVDIYDGTAIIGAYGEDTGAAGAGSVYIFTVSGTTWTQQAKLQSSDIETVDRFGWSVAIHEDTALIGAYLEDTGGLSAGAAYTFTRTGDTWTEQQKIIASDADTGVYFGYSVSIDDSVSIIGALSDSEFYTNAGAAYIFSSISSITNEFVSDGLTLSGTLGGTKTYVNTVTDGLSISGPTTPSGSIVTTISGGFNINDSIERDTFFNDIASDGITATDSGTCDATYSRCVTDNITISDIATCLTTYSKSVTDGITLSGTSSSEYGAIYNEVVSDGLSIADTLDCTVLYTTSASDTVDITDTVLDLSGISIQYDIQKPNVGALISLFSVDLSPITGVSGTHHFTNDTTSSGTNPVWGGQEYTAIPMELTGTEFNGKELPRPVLRVGNTASSTSELFIGWMVSHEDLVGATITRTRTFAKYLDGEPGADNSACFLPDLFTISQKMAQNKTLIEWELTGYMDMVGIGIPKRQVLKNTCTHRYRVYNTTTSGFNYNLSTCPYDGVSVFKSTGEVATSDSEDQCGKKLSDCKLRYIDTTNASAVTEGAGTPVGFDTYDLWLDTSGIPAVWRMFNGTDWSGTPKYLPLPSRAFPGIARRGR